MFKNIVLFSAFLFLLLLTACTNNHDNTNHDMHGKGDHHSDMIYEGSAEVPANLQVAKNPKFPVGTKAISIADHMGGMMENVEVTIVGAFETTAYATTYVSTTTGEKVKNHKWIVHEEFLNVGKNILAQGTKVATIAEHMKGMKDAMHTIEFSETTTVYMVDFITKNGKKVTNHKWVTEEELKEISD